MLNQAPNSKCGILYIDDEEKALKYFKMAFSAKFEVFTASSGPAGLEILRAESPRIGIIISDQKMPEMQGAEVLSVARDEFPQIVRILTTAYSDLDSAIQAVNKGHIYQYVVKPWEIQDLGMILQRAADYFQVLTERNELLSLKMTTLQRMVCSDRIKWLLLAGEEDEANRKALVALVQGLPADTNPFPAEKSAYSARDFDISALLKREYRNASRSLAVIEAPADLPAQVQKLVAALGLPADAATVSGQDVSLQLGTTPVQKIFGVLVEGEVSDEAILFFKTLAAVAASGGTLKAQTATASYDFSVAEPATPDSIIDSLFEKFTRWDIAKLH